MIRKRYTKNESTIRGQENKFVDILENHQTNKTYLDGIDVDKKEVEKFKPFEEEYKKHNILKKDGSYRELLIPSNNLKIHQRKILNNYLEKKEVSKCCKGFIKGASIVQNAKPHVKKNCILKMDISNFFPSIRKDKVLSIFLQDFTKETSELLADLCTYNGFLPQGAPTSPYIANLVMYSFDCELLKLIKFFNGNNFKKAFYTRYADDITISENSKIKEFIPKIKILLIKHGFEANEKKTKILKKNNRQKVTGIIVNEKLSVSKEYKQKIRQELYYLEEFGLLSHLNHLFKTKGILYDSAKYLEILKGKISFVFQVEPEYGKLLFEKYYEIRAMNFFLYLPSKKSRTKAI